MSSFGQKRMAGQESIKEHMTKTAMLTGVSTPPTPSSNFMYLTNTLIFHRVKNQNVHLIKLNDMAGSWKLNMMMSKFVNWCGF